ncbi:ComEC/Rec2 family competence protein [Paenibacillus protaetiae]|nr:ComEC/Rec2 family competence protein [Paenibacillus protaetiae]
MRIINRRPLVWFAVSWLAGASCAASLTGMGIVFAGLAVTAVLAALAIGKAATWRLAVMCLLAYGLASGERLWADARNVTAFTGLAESADPLQTSPASVSGTIVSPVEVDGDIAQFRAKLSSARVGSEAGARRLSETVLVRVRLKEQPQQEIAAAWQRGEQVQIAGELQQPAAQSNIGGFDYRRYLRSQGIHWLLQVQGTGAVHAAPGPAWTAAALLGRIDNARAWLGSRVDKLYPADQAGYMKGLVLGIREDLDPDQYGQFARLGLTHILAISGLHVAVFVYAFGGLLRLLRFTRCNLA